MKLQGVSEDLGVVCLPVSAEVDSDAEFCELVAEDVCAVIAALHPTLKDFIYRLVACCDILSESDVRISKFSRAFGGGFAVGVDVRNIFPFRHVETVIPSDLNEDPIYSESGKSMLSTFAVGEFHEEEFVSFEVLPWHLRRLGAFAMKSADDTEND